MFTTLPFELLNKIANFVPLGDGSTRSTHMAVTHALRHLSGYQPHIGPAPSTDNELKILLTSGRPELVLCLDSLVLKLTEQLAQILEWLPTSRLQTLRLCASDAEAVKALLWALEANTTLTNLDLRSSDVDTEAGHALAWLLKVNTVLTSLSLGSGDKRIGLVEAKAIAKSLKSGTSMLSFLDLSVNELNAVAGKALAEALDVNKMLIDLNLGANRIGPEGAKALADALRVNAVLTSLSLDDNELTNNGSDMTGISALAQALKVNTVLQRINLRHNELYTEGWCVIFAAICDNNKNKIKSWDLSDEGINSEFIQTLTMSMSAAMLKVLDTRGNSISGEEAMQLATAAFESKSLEVFSLVPIKELRKDKLTELNLNSKCLGPTEGILLAKLVNFSPVLETLDLSDNYLEAEAGKALADALSVNTVLKELNLIDNSIGPKGAKALADALEVNVVLTSLSLAMNSLTNDGKDMTGVTALTAAFKVNAVLAECDMLQNKINSECAKMLANIGKDKRITLCGIKHDQKEANFYCSDLNSGDALLIASNLTFNTTLTTLNLYAAEIGADGPEGIEAIAESLKSGTTMLTTLNLGANRLRAGGKAIADALKINTVLRDLDLYDNQLSDDGAIRIAEALAINKALISLNLDDNQFTAEGGTAIAKALEFNTVLTNLSVGRNSIGSEGAKAFADTLRVNEILTSLSLLENELHTSGIEALAEALKFNTVLRLLDISRPFSDVRFTDSEVMRLSDFSITGSLL